MNNLKDTKPVEPIKVSDIIIVILFLGAVIGIPAFFGLRYCMRYYKLRSFDSLINEYLTSIDSASPSRVYNNQVYINGKLIPIDYDGEKIDKIYFKLPKELRAKTPEEVKTIVSLNWGIESVAAYTDGSKAWKHICYITIIDKTIQTKIDVKTIEGSSPSLPHQKVSTLLGDEYGSKPITEIVDYLKTLPRK